MQGESPEGREARREYEASLRRIMELRPLCRWRSLRYLDHCYDRRGFRSLEGAEALTELRHLRIDEAAVEDLAPLRQLPLEELSFRNTRVRSIEPLLGMETLRRVEVGGPVEDDRSAMKQLEERLRANGGSLKEGCGPLADWWPEGWATIS